MIDALIFSKNRAAQLDLLLRSIRRHAQGLYRSLTVLYTGSSGDYLRGYQQCFAEHVEAKFVLEYDFESQVRFWLSLYGDDVPVSFLVDDDVFYRDAPVLPGLPCSLRGGDYDYPFSVDGNVYRRSQVETLLAGLRFRDPTSLEANAHRVAHERWPWFDRVTPVTPPCLVGVPANRVAVSSGMPHMGVDPRMLNDGYLSGYRLEVDVPAHLRDIFGAHEALDYTLERVAA